MNDEENENSSANEISFVKSSTSMDSIEYVSIQLKSSDETIDELIRKAISASKIQKEKPKKKALEAIA